MGAVDVTRADLEAYWKEHKVAPELCTAVKRFWCTRLPHTEGPHIAGDGRRIIDVWPMR